MSIEFVGRVESSRPDSAGDTPSDLNDLTRPSSWTTMNERSLWEEVNHMLSFHQKKNDPTPMDALNRLFHEAAPGSKSVRLHEDNCRISTDTRTTKELSLLKRRHKEADPDDESCPVLLVKYNTYDFLIDGCNRVNKWVKENNLDDHNAIVIEYPCIADK
jgi:hypothetical protein